MSIYIGKITAFVFGRLFLQMNDVLVRSLISHSTPEIKARSISDHSQCHLVQDGEDHNTVFCCALSCESEPAVVAHSHPVQVLVTVAVISVPEYAFVLRLNLAKLLLPKSARLNQVESNEQLVELQVLLWLWVE